MWNPWRQLRLIGAFTMIAGVILNNMVVNLLGILIQYIGVVGAVDLLERRIALLEPKENADGDGDER